MSNSRHFLMILPPLHTSQLSHKSKLLNNFLWCQYLTRDFSSQHLKHLHVANSLFFCLPSLWPHGRFELLDLKSRLSHIHERVCVLAYKCVSLCALYTSVLHCIAIWVFVHWSLKLSQKLHNTCPLGLRCTYDRPLHMEKSQHVWFHLQAWLFMDPVQFALRSIKKLVAAAMTTTGEAKGGKTIY